MKETQEIVAGRSGGVKGKGGKRAHTNRRSRLPIRGDANQESIDVRSYLIQHLAHGLVVMRIEQHDEQSLLLLHGTPGVGICCGEAKEQGDHQEEFESGHKLSHGLIGNSLDCDVARIFVRR